ncbi:hypothetical protein Ancab_036903 [Ancistrocladus abbreviatus]
MSLVSYVLMPRPCDTHKMVRASENWLTRPVQKLATSQRLSSTGELAGQRRVINPCILTDRDQKKQEGGHWCSAAACAYPSIQTGGAAAAGGGGGRAVRRYSVTHSTFSLSLIWMQRREKQQ